MADRMNFILTGQDRLSRVLDSAGDAARRMERRLTAAAINSDAAVRRASRNVVQHLSEMERAEDAGGRATEALGGFLKALAPAAAPAAASLVPLVAQTGAAGAAAIAFGAALGPQISAMGDAAEAEKKLTDAVEEHGAGSKEATQAQADYARQMAKLPAPTREAAAALSIFKDEYKDWSDDLAGDTMAPITKGMAVMQAILPKLTPMASSFGQQLDRVVTVAGGAVSTPGFDRLMTRFGEFTDRTLTRATTKLIGFLDRLDAGEVGGGVSKFFDKAAQQGPVVGDTLRNVVTTLLHVVEAAMDAGVGLLTVVNALSGIVSAIPPDAIGLFLQLAFAIKAVQLAAAGMAVARGAVAGFAGSLLAMQVAAGAATTRVGALTAAFGAMSRGAKLAIAGTGIGLLVLAIGELSELGKTTPPDVDRLTTSLKRLAEAGEFTGELRKHFGDIDGLVEKIGDIGKAALSQQEFIQSFGNSGIGPLDSLRRKAHDLYDEMANGEKSLTALKDDFGALDSAMAGLVQTGHADLAAANFAKIATAARAQGHSLKEVQSLMPSYTAAVDGLAAEQALAAQSMGLFGQQAQAVKAKLDAQKQSTDGLRQSIHALNNANLMARGGMRGLEAAIDAASEAAKENGKTLDITTEKGRANSQALDDLAGATMKAAESARENGASWTTVNEIYDKGRGKLIQVAQQMGLNETQARKLANQILATPNKTAQLRGNMEDLQKKLNNAKAQLARVPDSRKAAVRAQIGQLETALASARRQLAALDGRSATTYVTTHYRITGNPNVPNGTYYGSTAGRSATGGLIRGPGTGTSDSIPWLVSDGEFVVRSAVVDQPGVLPALEALNRDGVLPGSRPAIPVPVAAGRAAAVGGGSTTIINVAIHDAYDPMAVGQRLEQLLEKYRRDKGGGQLAFVRQP
ncbi:hypothetical protein ABZ498_06630 [Streptomyces lavendulocolor]|uniref:hypothetical protein n=1 Tax=Streptomyces lavendulocolor TaxID=67316 RepID=UPI0033CE230C